MISPIVFYCEELSMVQVSSFNSSPHMKAEITRNFCPDLFYQYFTAENMKFSIKDFFSKCDQIGRKLQILSYLLKKSLMESLIFLCNVYKEVCVQRIVKFHLFLNILHVTLEIQLGKQFGIIHLVLYTKVSEKLLFLTL